MSDIDYDALAKDAASVEVSDEDLKSIAELAERQMKLEDYIEKGEEKIAEAKARLAKITAEDLPEAMRTAGVKKFELADGCVLDLNSKIRANITDKNMEWCHTWLRDSGNGEIIRNEFKTSFGAEEDAQAVDFANDLVEKGLDFTQKESIPWNTLDAFVRVEIASNEPGEEWESKFGVYRQTFVKIERPKT